MSQVENGEMNDKNYLSEEEELEDGFILEENKNVKVLYACFASSFGFIFLL